MTLLFVIIERGFAGLPKSDCISLVMTRT